MMPAHSALFRLALRAFPARELAHDMQLVFEERYEERGRVARLPFALLDSADVLICGLRMRLEAQSRQPAVAALIVVAMLATSVAIHGATKPAPRFDFYGSDLRGAFTITIVDGKAVAATLDRLSVPRKRIVQRADSISILKADGGVALAVQFDPDRGHISWGARK